jgi:hypothetical protein
VRYSPQKLGSLLAGRWPPWYGLVDSAQSVGLCGFPYGKPFLAGESINATQTTALLVALALAIEQQINLGIGSVLPASPRAKQALLGAGEASHGGR